MINYNNPNEGSNFRINTQLDLFSDRNVNYLDTDRLKNQYSNKDYKKAFKKLSDEEKRIIIEKVKKLQEEVKINKQIKEYQEASLSKKKDMIKAQADSIKKQIEERNILIATVDNEEERRKLIAKNSFLQDEYNRYLKQSLIMEHELNRAYTENVSAKEKQAAIEEKIKKYQEEEKKIADKYKDSIGQLRLKYAEQISKSEESKLKDELDKAEEEYKQKIAKLEEKNRLSEEEKEKLERDHQRELDNIKENHQKEIDRKVDEGVKKDEAYKKLQKDKKKEEDDLKEKKKKDGIDSFGNLNIFKALSSDINDIKNGGRTKEALHEGVGALLNGDGLGKAFSSAAETLMPAFSKALGPVINVLTTIAGLVKSASNYLQRGIQESLNDQAEYLGKMNSRLQGSEESYQKITDTLTSNFANSPFISQRKALENIGKLVEAGTAVNIEQRGVLMTLQEKMVSTFSALEPVLLRMVRLQQTDVTAGQLGYEALLTQFLNEQFGDTSYLSTIYDNITESLIDAASQFDAKMASEFTYTVQKWLGSLYSVGMSSEGITKIAQGINYLATGNVEALNSDDSIRNLFAMATQGAYSNILTGGLNVNTVDELLRKVVTYLQSIAGDTNQVTKQAMSGVFGGFSFSDLRATTNLSNDTLNAIYNEVHSYDRALNEAQQQLYYAVTPYQNLHAAELTPEQEREYKAKYNQNAAGEINAYLASASNAEKELAEENYYRYVELYNSITGAGIPGYYHYITGKVSSYAMLDANKQLIKDTMGDNFDEADYKLFVENREEWDKRHLSGTGAAQAASNAAADASGLDYRQLTTPTAQAATGTAARSALTQMYENLVDNNLYTFGTNYIGDINKYAQYRRRTLLANANIPLVSGISNFVEGLDELVNGGFGALFNIAKSTFFATPESFTNEFMGSKLISELNNQLKKATMVTSRGSARYAGTPANIVSGISSMSRIDETGVPVSGVNVVTDFNTNANATASAVNSVVGETQTKDINALYSELFENQTTALKVCLSNIDSEALSSIGSAILNNTKSNVSISGLTDSALNALYETMHVDKLDAIEEKINDSVSVTMDDDFINSINNGLMYARSI